MLTTRLRRPEDENAVIELARLEIEECRQHLTFDEDTARQTFRRALETYDPAIFVLEYDGEVVGFFLAEPGKHGFALEHFLVLELLFVRLDVRDAQSEKLLLEQFMALPRIGKGFSEAYLAVPAGKHASTLTKAATKGGYQPMGSLMRRTSEERHVQGW